MGAASESGGDGLHSAPGHDGHGGGAGGQSHQVRSAAGKGEESGGQPTGKRWENVGNRGKNMEKRGKTWK